MNLTSQISSIDYLPDIAFCEIVSLLLNMPHLLVIIYNDILRARVFPVDWKNKYCSLSLKLTK
jgi:hypothetical protein